MRRIPETVGTVPKTGAGKTSTRRSLSELLAQLDELAARSFSLLKVPGAKFGVGNEPYELARYHFIGPQGGDAPIRVGIFAGIHGDEPEGSYALVEFAKILEQKPFLATGYFLSLYPVCNPTGFEDDTRHSRSGKDLNREFWLGSKESEVQLLQRELTAHAFHGIISLHADRNADGFYGVVRGATLAKHLVVPALAAAEAFLPPTRQAALAGFQAHDAVIKEWFKGALSAPPGSRPRPFEIALATPRTPPVYLRQMALVAALQSVLRGYRAFIAHAPNL